MSVEDMYARMALIRAFEQAAYRAYESRELEGTVHSSVGQEAVAVGVASALREGDKMLSHHRGHGHALAKGVDPRRLMAELLGRTTGVCGGKGGSMHITDSRCGFLGSLAVVGSSIPVAVGVALALRRAGGNAPGSSSSAGGGSGGSSAVCAVFFGDGAAGQGVLYESLNLAAIWRLPVLFVCENNSYAITTPAARVFAGESLCTRAKTFGVSAMRVDGQDAQAVQGAAATLLDGARSGRPGLLECLTYRFLGHSRSDPPHGTYRTREELASWQERDPLSLLRARAGLDERLCERLEREAEQRIEDALRFARSSPRPSLDDLERDVWG